jgi:hypothetical protein
MSFFSNLTMFLKYGSMVITAAKEVEALTAGGIGNDKKAFVLAIILASAHAAGEVIPNTTVKKIAGYIDFIVGILNATGTFVKATPVDVTVPKEL